MEYSTHTVTPWLIWKPNQMTELANFFQTTIQIYYTFYKDGLIHQWYFKNLHHFSMANAISKNRKWLKKVEVFGSKNPLGIEFDVFEITNWNNFQTEIYCYEISQASKLVKSFVILHFNWMLCHEGSHEILQLWLPIMNDVSLSTMRNMQL